MSSPCTHIAVIGSTNIDFVMHVTRFAQPGETMHVRSSSTGLGGKGANQAMAVARLGQTVALAGWTGQDMLADMARTTLEAAGVNTRWLLEDTTCGTGRAFITINAAGQNQILVDGGANMAHTDASLAHILPALDGAGLVMMQMEMDPTLMLAIARHARAHAIPVMLDPAPVPTDGLPEALCALADLITPNERETAALTGIEPTDETTALAAARILHARGVGTAIIKLGHRGVVYSAPDAQGFVPPSGCMPSIQWRRATASTRAWPRRWLRVTRWGRPYGLPLRAVPWPPRGRCRAGRPHHGRSHDPHGNPVRTMILPGCTHSRFGAEVNGPVQAGEKGNAVSPGWVFENPGV